MEACTCISPARHQRTWLYQCLACAGPLRGCLSSSSPKTLLFPPSMCVFYSHLHTLGTLTGINFNFFFFLFFKKKIKIRIKIEQVEGVLKVKEHVGCRTMMAVVCGERVTLQSKDVDVQLCLCSLLFSITLLIVFSDEHGLQVHHHSFILISKAIQICGID